MTTYLVPYLDLRFFAIEICVITLDAKKIKFNLQVLLHTSGTLLETRFELSLAQIGSKSTGRCRISGIACSLHRWGDRKRRKDLIEDESCAFTF